MYCSSCHISAGSCNVGTAVNERVYSSWFIPQAGFYIVVVQRQAAL